MAMTHQLKVHPDYFWSIGIQQKTFEVRLNDRDFSVHDHLQLNEYRHGFFGEGVIEAEIGYILKGFEGLKDNYVVLSLEDIRIVHMGSIHPYWKNYRLIHDYYNHQPRKFESMLHTFIKQLNPTYLDSSWLNWTKKDHTNLTLAKKHGLFLIEEI